MNGGEPRSPSLSDVEAVVRENVSGGVEGDQHEQGKQRLLAALTERKRPPERQRPRRWFIAGAVLALLLGGGAAYGLRGASKLTYKVSGGMVSDSGYVRSSGSTGARLAFSDGTRVDLQDGARARIAHTATGGVRLTVENGRVGLNVARASGDTWFVEAGPFVIQVAGTQFDVDWSSYDDTLSVDLHEGRLTVSGPPAPTGVLLHAGQRFTAHEGRLSIEALEMAVQVSDAPLPELDLFPLPEPGAPAPVPPVALSGEPPPELLAPQAD